MRAGLVLSVFPGIDVLGLGFEAEGYTVLRGPDPLWGSLHDIRRFHPPADIFEGVIGGPPCQAHSTLAAMVCHNGQKPAPNLIPEFARVVEEASPLWFLMENVPGAPGPDIRGYAVHTFLLNLRWLDRGDGLGYEQSRLRRFWFGVRANRPVDLRTHIREWASFENPEWKPAVLAWGVFKTTKRGRIPLRFRRSPSRAIVRESLQLQGLPVDFFDRSPFTVAAQQRLVGNAVPLPMARILARAVRRAVAELHTEVQGP